MIKIKTISFHLKLPFTVQLEDTQYCALQDQRVQFSSCILALDTGNEKFWSASSTSRNVLSAGG